jgi:hypothetical protein
METVLWIIPLPIEERQPCAPASALVLVRHLDRQKKHMWRRRRDPLPVIVLQIIKIMSAFPIRETNNPVLSTNLMIQRNRLHNRKNTSTWCLNKLRG